MDMVYKKGNLRLVIALSSRTLFHFQIQFLPLLLQVIVLQESLHL